MKNHYKDSWELYKLHTESFSDDFEYYYNFCYGYNTLELFAGYGRLSNYLISNKINIETVELEFNFAKHIKLPKNRNHISDVLQFSSNKQFDRIIAAYNSFCLLTEDSQIYQFFKKAESLLIEGGSMSLSHYPSSAWKPSETEYLNRKNYRVKYSSYFDISQIETNIATWIDEYNIDNSIYKFEYPTRIYKDVEDVLIYTANTKLKLVDIISDYNKKITDSGWLEYVFVRI
jgi:hypothetical protein